MEKCKSKSDTLKFNRESHIAYFNKLISGMSSSYIEFTQNHLSGAYFIVSAMGVLDALDQLPFTKQQIINWVYEFQVPVLEGDKEHERCYGFRGGLHLPFTPSTAGELYANDMGHIANTYCALAILKVCGDDFSRVNKKAILNALKYYQDPESGCFQCLPCEIGYSEEDTRFIYCACCICTILNDWSLFDKEKTIQYLIKCQSYSGGFGWIPGAEAHSSITYCVVTSLKMMGALDRIPNKEALVEYLSFRLNEGWNGRIGKPYDACYAYWNLGALIALGIDVKELVDGRQTEEFLLKCQRECGGFSKTVVMKKPDPIHSIYSLVALSFFGYFLLLKM